MRKVCGVLTAFVLSGAIFAASAETRTADEKSDVARVERELQAVEDAVAIHNRARERAEKAVEMSSLGQEFRRVKSEYAKFRSGKETAELPSSLYEKIEIYSRKYAIFVKKMTRIFLTDEIERAKQRKLDGLMRELKKIRERDYAHI